MDEIFSLAPLPNEHVPAEVQVPPLPMVYHRREAALNAYRLATTAEDRQIAMAAVEAAQPTLILAAREHYAELVKDKRVGFDQIACSQWRSDAVHDAETGDIVGETAPFCHCHMVPGNTLPIDPETKRPLPPHDASNYQGKPFCVAHQSVDCDGTCAAQPLEVFLRRFALPDLSSAK